MEQGTYFSRIPSTFNFIHLEHDYSHAVQQHCGIIWRRRSFTKVLFGAGYPSQKYFWRRRFITKVLFGAGYQSHKSIIWRMLSLTTVLFGAGFPPHKSIIWRERSRTKVPLCFQRSTQAALNPTLPQF